MEPIAVVDRGPIGGHHHQRLGLGEARHRARGLVRKDHRVPIRLEAGSQAIPMQVNQAQEPLYIVKPFSGGGFASLFSTHPPIEERVRRLRQMRPTIG